MGGLPTGAGRNDSFLDAAEHADGLQGFPQAHIIRQAGSESVGIEKSQPGISADLVGPQCGMEPSGKGRDLHALEMGQSVKEGFILRR